MKLGRAHLLFALMCLIWGTTWIAMKAGLEAVPPCFLAGTRFSVAGVLMLLFTWRRGELVPIRRTDIFPLAVMTMLMVVAAYALLYWGAKFVSTGLAAILDLALMPVALLAIGALLGEDRFTLARSTGIAIGVAGLLILFGPKAVQGGGAGGPMEVLGGTAIVVCALIYSVGSVLARPLLRTYPAPLLSGITLLPGGLVLFAGSLAFEPGATRALAGDWGTAAWAGWVFLVLAGSLTAYTIYLNLVREWGPSRAGAYAFVSPIVAVFLGVAVRGETVTLTDALGMATMLAGAWLTLRPAEPLPQRLPRHGLCTVSESD